MAISRVPGYSLLANLDRQGTDLTLTSSGLPVAHWDVTNYRYGINTNNPQEILHVAGNVLVANGNVYTSANIQYDIGTITNWWNNVYTSSVTAINLTGTLLTNAQPNITSVGELGNLSVLGNLTVGGLDVGNIIAGNISGDFVGNLTGYVLTSNQPFISNLGDITAGNLTVNDITVTGGNLDFTGNVLFSTINATAIFENGYQVLTSNSNIQVSGDVVGSGLYSNIFVELTTTGVVAGLYGSSSKVAQLTVDSKGRVTNVSNVDIGQIGNILINDTTISSNAELTLTTLSGGNIYINATGTGTVQFIGTDAVGLPAGDDTTRPVYPEVGYTRYNTARQTIEYYDGTDWLSPGAATISSEIINPDGVSNVYVLGSNTTVDGVLVSINGTLQQPNYSYDIINNNQIQFTEIPLTSDVVEVRFISVAGASVSSLRFGLSTAVILDNANVNVTGNILPSANVTYSLGSADYQWKDLWVSGNTIYIGGAPVTVTNGQLSLAGNIIGAAEPYGNVNVKAYADTMAYSNYSNVNVAAYIATNSGNITALGTITSGTWNADTLAVVYGGTGATTSADALNNLLPSGEQTGYVLTTSGAGSYYWASAGGGGGATVGQSLTTLRQSNTATSGQTVFNLVNNLTYTPGTGQLRVYIDGVRQFPDAYTETSSNAYTLSTGVSAGAEVFAEIDAFSTFNNYANLTYASNVGNIAASGLTVQSAIDNLENNKAPLAHPVFTGVTTVGGNLVVQGNLFVNGNLTTINANNLSISDSMIYLADDNPADTLDIGIVSAFTDAVQYQHTGLVRDATDGTWKLFANVVAEPTTTVDFTNATYSNLQVGKLTTTNDIIVNGNISANTNGYSIGYRDLPQFTDGNVALSLSNASKHFYANMSSPTTITVPSNANVAFPIGTTVVIVNRGAGNITINNQGTGAPFIYLAGNPTTTSSRTLVQYGMATLLKVEDNLWFINGTGII